MEECRGGGWDAWAVVWEAGRVGGGYRDEEWTALGLPQPKGPNFDQFFLSRGPHLAAEGAQKAIKGAGGMQGPTRGRQRG